MKNNKKIIEAIQKAINISIDDFDFNDNNTIELQKKHSIKTYNVEKYISLGLVDMGLPSGNFWAKYNIGVNPNKLNSNNAWFGEYYAWGELQPKLNYNLLDYAFANGKMTLYNSEDGIKTLMPKEDIATVSLGPEWRMPTKEDFQELIQYSNKTYVTNYKNVTDLNGALFTSTITGNEIFFPFNGMRFGNRLIADDKCFLWSSTLSDITDSGSYAVLLSLNKDKSIQVYILIEQREYGLNIRPIYNEKQ